ncbi:hypothetical protein GcM3_224020 [Golovinomyces cichoracearum]|uniref:Uncharacterized protein n=1 Tax=Golovinomyces cichoracearum TaxID=62708 RepID=A0A420GLG0_9PEZI|nr:hypothetical protein GcM3_224020 [Golovinomyces cichoracearum]
MEFSNHIKRLQPPEKFDGNSEMFHSWVLEMIDYFQNKEKDFGKSSNKGLVVYAKSRLDGKPANLLLRKKIAPCKDVLGWSNRVAISKFLSKLPIWTQRGLTKLRFKNDHYNEFLCELDDFLCRNYVSRQLLAASKRPQTSNLDDVKSKNSSDTDNSSVSSSKAKEKGSAQFNNQKLALKEELLEMERREGRCYYCHQKGHQTNLCRRKIVAEGSISNLECSTRTTNDEIMRISEASSTSSSESEN